MLWIPNDPASSDHCEADAIRIFEENHMFTKEELIASLECYLEDTQSEKNLTKKAHAEKQKLFMRFLSAVKTCDLPELPPNNWRFYDYEFVGNGVVLSKCTMDELEFEEDELHSYTTTTDEEMLSVKSEYVSVSEYALIQGVKEGTVERWIQAGKLECAKLDGDKWVISPVQEKPEKGSEFMDFYFDLGLHIDEFPLVQFSDNISICGDAEDRAVFHCTFRNLSTDFHEETVLTKKEMERLKYLIIATGTVHLIGVYDQYIPIMK